MSRGPGKWQRLILKRLEEEGWCVVNDLALDGSQSQRTALHRGAHSLRQKGLIDIWYRECPQRKTFRNYAFYRGWSESHQDRRMMVAVLPNHYPAKWVGHWESGCWMSQSQSDQRHGFSRNTEKTKYPLVDKYDPVIFEQEGKAWLEGLKALAATLKR